MGTIITFMFKLGKGDLDNIYNNHFYYNYIIIYAIMMVIFMILPGFIGIGVGIMFPKKDNMLSFFELIGTSLLLLVMSFISLFVMGIENWMITQESVYPLYLNLRDLFNSQEGLGIYAIYTAMLSSIVNLINLLIIILTYKYYSIRIYCKYSLFLNVSELIKFFFLSGITLGLFLSLIFIIGIYLTAILLFLICCSFCFNKTIYYYKKSGPEGKTLILQCAPSLVTSAVACTLGYWDCELNVLHQIELSGFIDLARMSVDRFFHLATDTSLGLEFNDQFNIIANPVSSNVPKDILDERASEANTLYKDIWQRDVPKITWNNAFLHRCPNTKEYSDAISAKEEQYIKWFREAEGFIHDRQRKRTQALAQALAQAKAEAKALAQAQSQATAQTPIIATTQGSTEVIATTQGSTEVIATTKAPIQ